MNHSVKGLLLTVLASTFMACSGSGGTSTQTDSSTATSISAVTISGTVSETSSAPKSKPSETSSERHAAMGGAEIKIIDSSGEVLATATADDDGNFSVEVESGSNYVVRSEKGNVSLKKFIESADSDTTVTVDPESSAEVKVLEETLGEDSIGEEGDDYSDTIAVVDVSVVLEDINGSELLVQVTAAIEEDISENADYTATEVTVGVTSTAGDDIASSIAINITITITITIDTGSDTDSGSDSGGDSNGDNSSDTTAPSGTVLINNGDSSTGDRAVTLTLSATDDAGITGYYASETLNYETSGWTLVSRTTSYSGTASFTLSEGLGVKTVYVWFVDSSGNVSAAASDTIEVTYVDTTAPYNLSISINGGGASTSNSNVTLSISGNDDVGITGYYISESSTAPISTGSGWVSVSSNSSYSSSVTWALSSGDGTKTLYLWMKDASGNVSSSVSDSITLDATAPTVTFQSPSSGSTGVAVGTTVSATFSEAINTSTVTTSTFTLSSGTSVSGTISFSGGNTIATFTPSASLANNATYTATLTSAITDVVGNGITATSWSFTTILGAPTGVSANAGNTQNTVSWSAVTGATSYNIYWGTSSGITTSSGTKITGATSPYTHGSLTNGTTYYYIVTAVNSGGEGSASSEVSATPVLGITGVYIDGAYQHTVALKSNGTVWAWGWNTTGLLGDGTTTNRHNPVQVVDSSSNAFTGVSAIAAGGQYTIALKSDGTVWTWGDNTYGMLGDGTTTFRSNPVQVVDSSSNAFTGVSAIAANYNHTVALKSDGTVWAWGRNGEGELGDGTTTTNYNPVQVVDSSGNPFTDVLAIAAGTYHTVALKNDGTVWAWGYNVSGELGDGTTTQRSNPVQVVDSSSNAFTGVSAIAAGYVYTVALKDDGTVWAWGWNGNSQLGDGTTTDRSNPVQVVDSSSNAFTGVSAIASDYNHTVALKSDGTVWTWGQNSYGELGDGTTSTNRLNPVQVVDSSSNAFTGVSAIAAGEHYTIALKSDDTIWAWGLNHVGQLGEGTTYTNRPNPVQVVDSLGNAFTR